jgi:hypothetical protein
MASPFPGMDPWLESPYIWGDFHQSLAGEIRRFLNRRLPKPYYARLESRPEIGIVEDEDGDKRRIGPDVAVVRYPNTPAAAVLEIPTRAISSGSFEVIVSSEAIKHFFVEVRDAAKGHELITLIEIVSPSNKRPGKDRRSYLRKQSEVLSSDANLVEIDLLRTGKRLFASTEIPTMLSSESKPLDYVILINRAWKRKDARTAFEVYPVSLVETLPCIPVPLREGQIESSLDLQEAFQEAYDAGPYRMGALDYTDPPLPPELATWADDRLRKAGVIA